MRMSISRLNGPTESATKLDPFREEGRGWPSKRDVHVHVSYNHKKDPQNGQGRKVTAKDEVGWCNLSSSELEQQQRFPNGASATTGYLFTEVIQTERAFPFIDLNFVGDIVVGVVVARW